MLLKEISPLLCNSTLCCGGRYLYKDNDMKQPYGYRMKCLTKNPEHYLWVYFPPNPTLKDKFLQLKNRCIASPVNLVEVSFTNLNINPKLYFGLPLIGYRATADDFFMED